MHLYLTISQKANNPTGLQNPSAWARPIPIAIGRARVRRQSGERINLGLSFASFGQAKEDRSYMPVGRQFGFIFEQFDVASTIAHEVSHGAFSLHHTFSDESESYHAPQGTTPNLMDYSGGTALNHLQWQWMHESHTNLLGFLDDESEGEMISISDVIIKAVSAYDNISETISETIDNVAEYFVAETDEMAIKALITTAEYIDPQVSSYDETAKQQIFKTDANKSVAILLYEFATGEGEESRVFTDLSEGSFANKFLEGRVIKEIEEDFYKEIEGKKYTYDEFKKSGIKTNLEFSPDHTENYLESIKKHLDSNLPQFFIGGAITSIVATNEKEWVYVELINSTSRKSLMLHIAENYKRTNGTKIPLSSIEQKIIFKMRINASKFCE